MLTDGASRDWIGLGRYDTAAQRDFTIHGNPNDGQQDRQHSVAETYRGHRCALGSNSERFRQNKMIRRIARERRGGLE